MPRIKGVGKYPKSLTFSVDENTFDFLNQLATKRKVPVSELLREALALYLKREGKTTK